MVAGIVVALILVGAIIAIWFYYRRRVENLKTEIAQVHYIADPTVLHHNDRNHFDNPVYSYQGALRKDDEANGLLNNLNHIKNNLGIKQNNTNLERQKLGMAACGSSDDDDSCKGSFESCLVFSIAVIIGMFAGHYEPPNMKNRDADLTNPNIYHSIDEKMVEHVYDEIKQKDAKEFGT